MQRFAAPAFLAVSLAFVACEKSTEPSGIEPGQLTGKQWVIAAWTADPPISVNGKTVSDLMADAEPCTRDNFISFQADGNAIEDEGPTKCSADMPQTVVSRWSLSADGKSLKITKDEVLDYKVLTLTASTLKMTSSFEGLGGKTHTFTVTLKAK